MAKHEGLTGYSAGVLFGGINRILPETRKPGYITDDLIARKNEIRRLALTANLLFAVAEIGEGYVDFRIANRPYRLWDPWDDPRNDRIRDLLGEGRDEKKEQVPVVPPDHEGVASVGAWGRDDDVEVDHDAISDGSPVGSDGNFGDQESFASSNVRQQPESEVHAPEVRVDPQEIAERDPAPVTVHEVLPAVSVPVKRTLSAEHLQKLAEGRERARQNRLAEQAKGE